MSYQKYKWARELRHTLLVEQDGCCFYCKIPLVSKNIDITFEHLKRKVDGGTNDPSNLVLACALCNSHRIAEPPHLWKIICTDVIRLRTISKQRQNELNNYVRNKKISRPITKQIKRWYRLKINMIVFVHKVKLFYTPHTS